MYVLNFYSPLFVDQLKRGRKTATIRLGDKSKKYRKGEVVLITVGFQHSPRERKTVEFFLFSYRSGNVEDHDHEVEEALWIPLADAPERLAYKGEREMAVAALSRVREGR